MSDPLVSIIIRSYNEGWALRETLPAVQAQEFSNRELIVIDSGSTDGSVKLIQEATPRHFVQITHEEYNPSRVMNLAMQLARAEFGIFLNADATPQGPGWLRPLVEALQDPTVAAVFGKQIPRPDCQAVYAHDYERCFGPEREFERWDHFFSMVSSGLRKDIWARRGFLEKMQYSEDDEYTRWCCAQGYKVVYVPDSVVMHSHNYTPGQAYRRSFGEAKALAAVWSGRPQKINWPRTVMLGWLNDARRDLRFCARTRRLREWPHAVHVRWNQRRAKLAGFREGWRFYRNGDENSPARPTPAAVSPAAPARDGRNSPAPQAPAHKRRDRFTLDGSDALENHIARLCHQALAGVQSILPQEKLEALVLGGGYGRGQGGVLKTEAGDQPYNDLEFYVFTRGPRLWNERHYRASLQHLGERLSPPGLHVEFKIDSLRLLRRSSVTMFSYDLVSGHRVIGQNAEPQTSNAERRTPNDGAPDQFDVGSPMFDVRCSSVFAGCDHHLDATRIPSSEAARLLFNRCTGLLLAKELLRRDRLTAEQADFIGRNLAKARLALGDAVLTLFGNYHWSCVERRARLDQLAASGEELGNDAHWLPALRLSHAAGVEFKLHPRRLSKSAHEFRAEHRDVSGLAREVWLWLESRRLTQPFPSVRDYAFSPLEKCGDTRRLRNFLLNAKSVGPHFDRGACRYPRERLLNALPLLLWDEPFKDLRVKRHLQNQLHSGASDWQGLVAAYKALWRAFG